MAADSSPSCSKHVRYLPQATWPPSTIRFSELMPRCRTPMPLPGRGYDRAVFAVSVANLYVAIERSKEVDQPTNREPR